jgi:hypothetical protein
MTTEERQETLRKALEEIRTTRQELGNEIEAMGWKPVERNPKMLHCHFSQEDLQEALAKVSQVQQERLELNGEQLHHLQARAFLLGRDELSRPQFQALLWAWGE